MNYIKRTMNSYEQLKIYLYFIHKIYSFHNVKLITLGLKGNNDLIDLFTYALFQNNIDHRHETNCRSCLFPESKITVLTRNR